MAACVLVVEDDPDLRESLADVLREEGYTVHVAAHGGEALIDMRECAPCIVLLDLMMPVMDGWQLVAAMEVDPALAAVPVCVVSAMSVTAPRSVRCVLAKPISLPALLAAVQEHCGPGCTPSAAPSES